MNELVNLLLEAFAGLSDHLKLAIFVLLIAALVGVSIWKYVGWRRQKALKRQVRALRRERDELLKRFESLDQVDDYVWKRPDKLGLNCPVPMQSRTTRFIAICNLKGGVGKTTLSVNLGVGLALEGKRVLLIDLDFQGTLSGFLLPKTLLQEYRANGWTTDALLPSEAPLNLVRQYAFPVEGVPQCRVMIARETLELAEFKEQARYFVSEDQDPRFRLQKLLHSDHILQSYDYVLLDCPPRMTTACLNAMTAADYLLVPTTLSEVDIDAARRTLTWLRELQGIVRAEVLGVIVSRRKMTAGRLVHDDRALLANLEELLRTELPNRKALFDAKVVDSREIHRAASQRQPAVLRHAGMRTMFQAVCAELQRRIHP
jgi:chromosome partitioning protein